MAYDFTDETNFDNVNGNQTYPLEQGAWSQADWEQILKLEEFAEAYENKKKHTPTSETLEDEFPELFDTQDCPF